jgi:hypothetical protein
VLLYTAWFINSHIRGRSITPNFSLWNAQNCNGNVLQIYAKQWGIPVCVVRLFSDYGADLRNNFFGTPVARVRQEHSAFLVQVKNSRLAARARCARLLTDAINFSSPTALCSMAAPDERISIAKF